MQANTKPCPSCFEPSAKVSGCLHVRCPNPQCKLAYNWCCMSVNPDPDDPFASHPHNTCPRHPGRVW